MDADCCCVEAAGTLYPEFDEAATLLEPYELLLRWLVMLLDHPELAGAALFEEEGALV